MSRTSDNVWKKIMRYGLESIGLFYSSYRGMVTSVSDPLNIGRLQIQVPQVDGRFIDPTWVPCKGLYGGKDYGVQFLPKVGDVVWVEYAYGKPNRPIWSHHGWAENEKPAEFNSPNVFGFKTPYGQLVTIDDGTFDGTDYKGAKITIKTREGNIITLDEDSGEVIIDGQKKIKLGSDNLEPVLLGNTTQAMLDEMLTAIGQITVTVQGVPTPINNLITFASIQAQDLPFIKSKKVETE